MRRGYLLLLITALLLSSASSALQMPPLYVVEICQKGGKRDREQKEDFLTRKGHKQAGREMEAVRGRAGVCSQLTNAVPQSSTGLQL